MATFRLQGSLRFPSPALWALAAAALLLSVAKAYDVSAAPVVGACPTPGEEEDACMLQAARTPIATELEAYDVSAAPVVGACPTPGEEEDACMLQAARTPIATELEASRRDDRASSICNNIGARLWVSRKALLYLRESLLPPLLAALTNMRIPKQMGAMDGFTYELSDFVVRSVVIDLIELSFVEGVGIKFVAGGIRSELTARYRFEGSDYYNPLWSSGSIAVSLGRGTESAGVLKLGSKAGKPTAALKNLTTYVDLADLRVELSSLSWVWDSVGHLFKRTLEHVLRYTINEELRLLATTDLAEMLERVSLKVGLPAPLRNRSVDFSICAVTAGTDHLRIDLHSSIFEARGPSHGEPGIAGRISPTQPPSEFESRMLTARISKQLFGGGIRLFEEAGLLHTSLLFNYTAENKMSHWTWWFGPKRMGITAALTTDGQDPDVRLAKGSVNITVGSKVDVKVTNLDTGRPATEFSAKMPVQLTAHMSILNNWPQKLLVGVSALSVTPVRVKKPLIGGMPSWLVDAVLQNMVETLVMPKIDQVLAEGFPISSSGSMSLVKTNLALTSTGLVAESDIWLDPSAWLRQKYGKESASRTLHLVRSSGSRTSALLRG